MDYDKPPAAAERQRQRYGTVSEYEAGDGCLAQVIRIPLRILVVLLVVPVRMVWDVLVVCGRALHRALLRPAGRALARLGRAVLRHVLVPVGKALFVWPWVALWRYVVVPVVAYGLVVPAVWLYRHALAPLGRGIAWAWANLLVAPVVWIVANLLVAPLVWLHRNVLAPLGRGIAAVMAWLGRALFVWPWVALWRYVVVPVVAYGLVVPVVWICRYGLVLPAVWLHRHVLTPVGRGFVWLLVHLVVAPAAWVYRHVLAPVGRETVASLRLAWQFAGYVSRAVGRGLKWLGWHLVVRPSRWFHRAVCTPVGHFVRDAVWRPAARAAVEAGRTVRAAFASARLTLRRARRDAWRALGGGTAYTSGSDARDGRRAPGA